MSPSAAQLGTLAPHCDAAVIAPALAGAAEEREINTSRRLAHWLGQLSVESGGFTHLVENLNYSAERLCQVWPGRFPDLIAATPYAHAPEKLAERTYGGRMGNTQPGDGYRFRGRGFIMTTGRENYAAYGSALGVDLIGNPDLAAEPVTAARLAALFWAKHGLNALADADDVEAITRAINGGLTGLADRKAAIARAKIILQT